MRKLGSALDNHIAQTTNVQGAEKMQKRKLGNSNLEVSAIGLGCMGITPSRRLSCRGIDIPQIRKNKSDTENVTDVIDMTS